jgi:hypothetical protein
MLAMNLAYGEMEPQDNIISKENARNIFLNTIKKEMPEILHTLYNNVYPIYRQLIIEIEEAKKVQTNYISRLNKYKNKKNEFTILAWNDKDIEDAINHYINELTDEFYPDLIPLKDELIKWAERYNINCSWILETAIETMGHWYRLSPYVGNKIYEEWQYRGVVFWGLDLPLFEFPEKFKWDIAFETEKQFKEKVRTKFNEYLNKYIEKCRIKAQEMNYTKSIEKRQVEHFEWFVLYQIKGWELPKITEFISQRTGKFYEESNIYKNVKKISQLIELPLRDGYR